MFDKKLPKNHVSSINHEGRHKKAPPSNVIGKNLRFVSSSSGRVERRHCVSLVLLFHQDRCLHLRQTTVDFCLPKLSIFHVKQSSQIFFGHHGEGLWRNWWPCMSILPRNCFNNSQHQHKSPPLPASHTKANIQK